MPRSVWKSPFVAGYLLKKVADAAKTGSRKIINVWARSSTILPQFVGINFGVYNGKKFIPVFITEEMVGFKLGEFSPTRTFHGHGGDKKVKRS